jgi:hypothetical protein
LLEKCVYDAKVADPAAATRAFEQEEAAGGPDVDGEAVADGAVAAV